MDSQGSAVFNAQYVIHKVLKRVNKTAGIPKQLQLKPAKGAVDLTPLIPKFCIDDVVFEKLLFRETLVVGRLDPGNHTPVPVGGLNLDIQKARGNPFHPNRKGNTREEFATQRKFLIHLSSQLDHKGGNGGSRITSWVDRNMQTLEEKKREYIRRGERLDQKHLYTSTQSHFYYLRENKDKDIIYTPEKACNLISEGANFLLMRYLAICCFIGTFEVTTTYINGDLCRNIYDCKGPSSGIVNDKKLDICKIFRTVMEECGIVHKSVTVLTLQGQLLKQEWEDCAYVLQLNPLADVSNEKPTGNLKIPLEKSFANDLELLSKYLDCKTVSKKQIATYMKDHKEVKDLIADYVAKILQMKPDDILEFTAKFFLNFAPELLPLSEYFEKDQCLEGQPSDLDWRHF